MQLSIHGSRSRTVFAFQDALGLFRDGLVTLASQYVQYRLGTNDLRGWSNQWDITQVFTNARNFFQNVIELVRSTLLAQLVFHVGQHATWHLSHQNTAVGTFQGTFELGVLLTNLTEVSGNLFQQQQVDTGITLGASQCCNDGFGSRVAVGHGHGRNGSINAVNTGFHSLQDGHVGQTGSRVRMQLNFQVSLGFQAGNQLESVIRRQYTGHVFNGDGVCTHVFDLFGQIDPGFQRVNRTGGVRQCALGVFALLFHCFQCGVQVARVVHGVKNAENVHTVGRSALNELFNHVVSVVTITQQVLTAQQHLVRGLWHGFLEFADTVPRVFAEETDT